MRQQHFIEETPTRPTAYETVARTEASKVTGPKTSAPVEAVTKTDLVPTFRRGVRKLDARRATLWQRGFTRLRAVHLSKRGATLLLIGALGFGGRWYWANQTPIIPALPLVETSLDGPNATHFFAAAVDGLPGKQFELFGGPDSSTLVEQREVVQTLAPSLSILREGLKYHSHGNQTRYWKGASPYQTGWNAPVSNFMAVRTLGRALVSDARLKEQAGDAVGASAAALDAATFGVEFGQGSSTLLQGMIGELVLDLGLTEASRSVARLSPREAKQTLARLQCIAARRPTLAQLWNAEQSMNRDILQKLFESPQEGLRSLASSQGMERVLPTYFADVMRYGKQGLVNQVVDYQNLLGQRLQLPYQQAQKLDVPPRESGLTELLTPNIRRFHCSYTERTLRLEQLKAQLARQAGVTVGSQDPFSLSGTDPLRVDRATGETWSVGHNGVDEHGGGDDITERSLRSKPAPAEK